MNANSAAPTLPRCATKGSRKHALAWGGIIVGLLLLQIVLCTAGAYCAVGGRGVAVESDYYNKALHWDDHLALEEKSRRLGWTTQLDVGSAETSRGERALMLNLHDRTGAPLNNADVEIAYFHHAHALDLRKATLRMIRPGFYSASVELEHRGIWEFRLTVKRGKDTFIQTIQQDLE